MRGHARAPAPPQAAALSQHRGRVQSTYAERDAEEYQGNVLTQEAGLQPAYRSMHLTDRATVVTAATEPSWSLQLASAQEQVAAFLRSRGLPTSVRPPPTSPTAGQCPPAHTMKGRITAVCMTARC